MTYLGSTDPRLEIALGNIAGRTKINKFGQATDADSGVNTDIWDGADGETSTVVWVAPTQARTHDITSTSANDDGDALGTGMRTIEVFGLTDWDSAESSEIVTLNGTSSVATASAYVIIHRMIGITFGSGGTNEGTIAATAQIDGTVTAAIVAGVGKSLMAIYGVPSTQTLQLVGLGVDILKAGGGAGTKGNCTLSVKESADSSDAGYVTNERFRIPFVRIYRVPKSVIGPAIVKMQVNTDTINTTVTGAFDAILVDN